MIRSMRGQYCSKGGPIVERDLSDGTKIGICKKGWSVFFATMRKKGWDEKMAVTNVTETAFLTAVDETMVDMVDSYLKKRKATSK